MERNEKINDNERSLAAKLRSLCSPFGDELHYYLAKSGNILLEYGKMFLEKVGTSHGLQRKVNFIRSAVFLFAAKSRQESVSASTDETLQVIQALHISITAMVLGKNFKVIEEVSRKMKDRLQELRQEQKVDLSKTESCDKGEQESIQIQVKKKVERVRNLLKKNAKNYRELMKDIASKCQDILGKPPCKFAIAGAGSLARKEVTLYSSFKYVIILEESAKKRSTYDTFISEYFQWFAVLFQIIIIGLEETPITSITVHSLKSDNGKNTNWFYDAYTRSGVSIEGMMPLIYQTHVGPHENAEDSEEIQLIKPVSEMVNFLSTKNDIDRGMNLKHLLRKSYFVFGQTDVFNEFSSSRDEIIFSECSMMEVSYLTSKIDDDMPISPHLTLGMYQINSASFLYWPISACLGYIGSLFRWGCCSGFEIIENLKRSHPTLHVIFGRAGHLSYCEWALAVTCELRMKVYAIDNGSRKKNVRGCVSCFADRSSLEVCIRQAWNLSRSLESIRNYASGGGPPQLTFTRFFTEDYPLKVFLFEELKTREKINACNISDQKLLRHMSTRFCIEQITQYLYVDTENRCINKIFIANEWVSRNPGYEGNGLACEILAFTHLKLKQYSKALDVCEAYINYWGGSPPRNPLTIYRYQIEALTNLSSCSEDVVKFCDDKLKSSNDNNSTSARLAFECGKIFTDIHRDGGRERLKQLARLAMAKGPVENDIRAVLLYLDDLFNVQFDADWFEDATLTMNIATMLMGSDAQFTLVHQFPAIISRKGFNCHLRMSVKFDAEQDISRAVRAIKSSLYIWELMKYRVDHKSSTHLKMSNIESLLKKF